MKKLAVFLSVILLLAMACLVPSKAQEAPPAQLYGALQKIKESGKVVIGHREASVPFSFLDDQKQPAGFSVDLCLQIVEEIKTELGMPDLTVEFTAVNPQTRIPLIANNTIDLECGSTTNNLTRRKQVDYALTTFVTGTKLLVKKDSGIKEIEDLAGKSVAVSQGTTNERVIKAFIEANNIDARIVNVKEVAEGLLSLETDRVDALGSDDILLYGQIVRSKTPDTLEVVGRRLSYDPYAIMMRRDDSALRLVADRRLSKLFASGEFNTIYSKWFEPLKIGENTVPVPMGDGLKNAVELQAFPE
ncbi:MAG: amino acid ABC transporter substrate-binding protein [Cyanobacteriota bacterium]|nr:amino acid ABC transporter substrate-binding protein [Cyanobacteriota bacterium]